MSGYETVLFVARECFVYRVPPRSSTAGYKAGEWGDMEAFLWKGRLRIMESSNSPTCSIRLEDGETGELFAESPYDVTGTSVEPVLDSSRYFVLRVESEGPDGKKKKAYIGMGVSTSRSQRRKIQQAMIRSITHFSIHVSWLGPPDSSRTGAIALTST